MLKALREDERAAISLGKSARSYRIQAFAAGGAVMGLAGAVQAHFIGFIAQRLSPTRPGYDADGRRISPTGALFRLHSGLRSGRGRAFSAAVVPNDRRPRRIFANRCHRRDVCLILLWRPQGFFGPQGLFGKRRS